MTTFANSNLVGGYDGTPLYRPQAQMGGGGRQVTHMAVISAGATDATTVVYRMVRVPTNVTIQKVEVSLDKLGGTVTTFTGNVGIYYSDNGAIDGTSLINSGSTTPISTSFFAYQIGINSTVNQWIDLTFNNVTGNSATDGYYIPSASFQPLWVALTCGGFQGLNSLNAPKGPPDGLYAGTGAISATSNNFYHLAADPGGFVDICFNPTTTNSLSAAMNFAMKVSCMYPA